MSIHGGNLRRLVIKIQSIEPIICVLLSYNASVNQIVNIDSSLVNIRIKLNVRFFK